MKKPVKFTLIGLGAVELFLAALIGFAFLLGAEMHRLPLVGALFPTPEEVLETAGVEEAAPPPTDEKPPERLARLGVLETFSMDSPYSASQLKGLVEELKSKRNDLDLQFAELREREAQLDQRAELLDEKYADLQQLFTRLEERAAELDAREAELQRTEEAEAQREEERWKTLAALFADGEVEALTGRLLGYEPADAARLLKLLEPDRAKELLDALPPQSWQAYAEAYSGMPPAPAGGAKKP